MPSQPAGPEPTDRERQRHDLRNSVTQVRLQTQLLHRLAARQDGPAWQRMAAGLATIDAGISTVARQLAEDEPR